MTFEIPRDLFWHLVSFTCHPGIQLKCNGLFISQFIFFVHCRLVFLIFLEIQMKQTFLGYVAWSTSMHDPQMSSCQVQVLFRALVWLKGHQNLRRIDPSEFHTQNASPSYKLNIQRTAWDMPHAPMPNISLDFSPGAIHNDHRHPLQVHGPCLCNNMNVQLSNGTLKLPHYDAILQGCFIRK